MSLFKSSCRVQILDQFISTTSRALIEHLELSPYGAQCSHYPVLHCFALESSDHIVYIRVPEPEPLDFTGILDQWPWKQGLPTMNITRQRQRAESVSQKGHSDFRYRQTWFILVYFLQLPIQYISYVLHKQKQFLRGINKIPIRAQDRRLEAVTRRKHAV